MTYYPSKYTLNYYITLKRDGREIHRMIWSIPNFETITDSKYIKIIESQYVDNINPEHQFKLKLRYRGINREFIEIYYLYQKQNVVLDKVLLTIYCKGYKENIKKDDNGTIEYNITANKWTHLQSYTHDIFTTAYNHCAGVLTLDLEFTIRSTTSEYITENVPEIQPIDEDLDSILLNGFIFSDVILKSVEGYEFHVHKFELSRYSTVLRSFFVHNNLETRYNLVTSHFSAKVLRAVLTYIYTNKAPGVQEIADKILEAADYYNIPVLKKISEEILYLQLTPENAFSTLHLADLYSATELKQSTMEYIDEMQEIN